MTLAFFDLDRTLLNVNSASLWVQLEWRNGRLSTGQLLRLSLGLLRYHFGLANLEKDLRLAVSRLKGESDGHVRAQVKAFYQNRLRHHYRPGGLSALHRHRQRGDAIVLLTSSPQLLAQLVADDLDFQAYLCTQLEIDDDGHFTGQIIEPLCFGAGKVELATTYARSQHIALTDCTFYTDSITDMPMLQAVGTPIVVNPDPRLRRAARAEDWPIVDWGIPDGPKRTRQTTRRN